MISKTMNHTEEEERPVAKLAQGEEQQDRGGDANISSEKVYF